MAPDQGWRRAPGLLPLLRRLQQLSGRISVEDWADAAGISARTLQRRFAAVEGAPRPREVLFMRLESEHDLGRASGDSTERTAERLGYESGSTLRRALRRGRELRHARAEPPRGADGGDAARSVEARAKGDAPERP